MLKLAALVGPTSVGKTEISIGLAKRLGGEIISCDSMQVYKGMDIGTAKVGPNDRNGISHYMIDLVEPGEIFTVADYQKLAKEQIISISQRGKLPILVGGTGLYYQSVVDNYDFFPMEAREIVRNKWEQVYVQQGLEYIYEKALAIDKEYVLKIGPNDKKRLIRALEVYDLTGQPFSSIQTRNKNTYLLSAVGLYLERNQLYARINERVDKMIEDGLLEEVVQLRERGCDLSLNSMQALGYRQIYSYLEGMLSWEETLREIKRETRRYAKRQYTWFNKDKRITWIDIDQYSNTNILLDKICDIMEGQLFRA